MLGDTLSDGTAPETWNMNFVAKSVFLPPFSGCHKELKMVQTILAE